MDERSPLYFGTVGLGQADFAKGPDFETTSGYSIAVVILGRMSSLRGWEVGFQGGQMMCKWLNFSQGGPVSTSKNRASHRDILCAGYLRSGRRGSQSFLYGLEDGVLRPSRPTARVSAVAGASSIG